MILTANGSDREDEWVRLGVAAQMAGRLPEAQQHYANALRLNPRHLEATQNTAIVFAQSNLINEALLTMERATIWDDTNATVWLNYALMGLETENLDLALRAADKAIEISPIPQTWFIRAILSATAGMPEKAVELYNKVLDKEPKHLMAATNACFVQTLTMDTSKELAAQRKRWYEANHYTGPTLPIAKLQWDGARPLRVGYVSGDFKCHSAAMIFGSVVMHHNRAKIEPLLYSTLAVDPNADGMTKRFKEMAGENWRDISTLDDEKAELLIRKDQIDILVDLAGHTNGGRLQLFTRKPAPIQVTAWGFAHGTGVPEIDYFLADKVAVPEVEREHFVEKIWDVPCIVSYLPNDDVKTKAHSMLPFHQNGNITFGTFCRYEKMNDTCIRLFGRILKEVPESRLMFKDNAYRRPYSIKRIMAILSDIDPKRLLFSIATSHVDHLLAYQQADIILDPFPHSGGVVCLEQLYMGVPIVTMFGWQPGGRTTSSVLANIGHPEWIGRSEDEYVSVAVKLAGDINQLQTVRKKLRQELLDSPVIKGYCEKIEEAYIEMAKIKQDRK